MLPRAEMALGGVRASGAKQGSAQGPSPVQYLVT